MPQKFARVPNINCHGLALKYITEKIWKLSEPEILISVNGGAADFNLSAETTQKVLHGLMKAESEMDVWFLSGGTNLGVMRMLGEARAKLAPRAPLIGCTTWGSLPGAHELMSATKLEEAGQGKSVNLDNNHSHFFLIDNGKHEFFAEQPYRTAFEKAVHNRIQVDAKPLRSGCLFKIPYVCICIEGGVGSIGQMHAVSQQGMAILSLKGTGRAADFLGDLALLRFDNQSEDARYISWKDKSLKHRLLCQFFHQIDREQGGVSAKARTGLLTYPSQQTTLQRFDALVTTALLWTTDEMKKTTSNNKAHVTTNDSYERSSPCVAVCCSVLQCAAVCCSVLQCVAVCCSVLQCAVCCSV